MNSDWKFDWTKEEFNMSLDEEEPVCIFMPSVVNKEFNSHKKDRINQIEGMIGRLFDKIEHNCQVARSDLHVKVDKVDKNIQSGRKNE